MATAAPPTPDELAPLLGESATLDEPAGDPYEGEDGAFMVAARQAVGTEANAMALKDAIEACLRSHGIIGAGGVAGEDETQASDLGEGFEDF